MKRPVVANNIGACPECGKLRYVSKASAKKTVRQLYPHEKLSVYPCGDYWHFGHLPYAVQRGWSPRPRTESEDR